MTGNRLSDTRGTRPGILFFIFWLRVFGFRHACGMVWLVSFFYAVFDAKARAKVLPYVRRRFPESGRAGRFFHSYAVFAHQGQALLVREAMKRGLVSGRERTSEESRALRESGASYVLLYSHFGPWQAMMNGIDVSRNTVNILMKPDLNLNIDKMSVLADDGRRAGIRIVSTESALGGLWEADCALERGEIVVVMGDRCLEKNPVPVEFLGEKAYFPAAAFRLAARHSCPVICIFACREGKTAFALDVSTVLHPVERGRDRSALVPCVGAYVRALEKMCMDHPYDCFLFEDVWRAPA